MVSLRRIPQRLRDTRDFADEYIDFSEEPIRGLVPVGDTGLFVTPDEPADPRDCERYPDSPFCGANPFTTTPIGLEPKIIIGDCDIGVTLNPVFGFVKLPSVSLVYRKPECRELAPQPIPNYSKDDFSSPVNIPLDCANNVSSLLAIFLDKEANSTEIHFTEDNIYVGEGVGTLKESTNIDLIAFDFPYQHYKLATVLNDNRQIIEVPIIAHFKVRVVHEIIMNDFYNGAIWLNTIPPYKDGFGSINTTTNDYYLSSINTIHVGENLGSSSLTEIEIHFGKTGEALQRLEQLKNTKRTETNYDGDRLISVTQHSHHNTVILKCGDGINTRIDKHPPPPKEPCCMAQCCPPPDDALLKLLLKKVSKLSEILGVDRFPAEFPKRLTYPNASGSEKVKDLVELLGFQIKQVDRAVGYLPQKIKVADTNPGLAGNQSVEIEIHSFADFCKQILEYIIDTEGDGDTTNNMLVRALYELGFIHQGVVQGNAMLDATVDHLDFKHKWKKIRVPFAFDPYAGQKGKVGEGFEKQKNSGDNKTEEAVEALLPKLLSNTEVEIRILVNDEKKSLNDMLQDIKRDTAMAAAAVADKSTPERLEQLVAAAQLMLQLQNAIDRRNMRQALVSGNLKTRRIKK